MITKLTRTVYTETGHRISNYDGACSNLHGHSYKWDLTFSGEVDKRTGFVIDFKILKGWASIIENAFDHTFVAYKNDPIFNGYINLDVHSQRVLYLDNQPTVENMLAYIAPQIMQVTGDKLKLESIKCRETHNNYAEIIL